MDSPVFKLEQVVHNREGLEDFEGPLDLILFLLSKNKIEIQDIPIALILDQYLAYLELRQRMDLEVASEFITMAAQLMFIKTRMLLSLEDEEAQSEMDQLIRSLEERRSSENYARIKAAAAKLGPMGEFGRNIMVRGPEPVERGKVYLYDHQPEDLLAAMQEIAGPGRAARTAPPDQFHGDRQSGALPRGQQGRGDPGAAEAARHHQLPPAVPGQPQPQRGGGHLHRGAGAVQGQDDPPGGQRHRLHRHPHRRGWGHFDPVRSSMTLEMKELEAAVEGILFASGEPVHIDRICLALDIDRLSAQQILQRLGDYYAYERRGMRLIRMEDTWQLCSAPDYADIIRRAFEIRKSAKLSQPALEVLSIIAYYQPTTRAYVDQVRGVDSAYTVGLLLDRKLIEECGRLQVPGRPRLYRTTKNFLRAFHLTSLEDLPDLPGMEAEGQLRLGDDGALLDGESRRRRQLRKRALPRRHQQSERQRGACKAWRGSWSWA